MKTDIAKIRREYSKKELDEKNVSSDPFIQFKNWFNEVLNSNLPEPTAMALSTCGKDGRPSSRMVLLKDFDENGYVFYTNYESSKGQDLDENPFASLLFYWAELERQVRIEGSVSKVGTEQSEQYFKTRPLKSRIGAWASKQSSVIESRATVIKEFMKYSAKFALNAKIPLPEYWGGYVLKPDKFEFWQGRENRLHDRIQYRLSEGKWIIERLSP